MSPSNTSGGGGENFETISSSLFNLSREDQINFEIVTSTVLSAITLATAPLGFKANIIRVAALLLPAIAAFHWSLNANRFSNEDYYFHHTYRVVEFLGIIVLFYIIHTPVDFLLTEFSIPLNVAVANLFGTIIFTLTIIVFIELIYKSYRLFWGTAMFIFASSAAEDMKNSDDEINSLLYFSLYNFSAQLAYHLLKHSIPEGEAEELQALRDFVSEVENELGNENTTSLIRLFFGVSAIVIPLFAFIAYTLSMSLITVPFIDVFLILCATRITKHIIEVPALIFGTLSYSDYLQTNLVSLLTLSFYTTAVYWIFFI